MLRPTDKLPAHVTTDSWDPLDLLDVHAAEPEFPQRWRGFVRACVLRVIPALSAEALAEVHAWIAAADAYDRGELVESGLTEARVRAWGFHSARRKAALPAELDALRIVMWRMWPEPAADDWFLEASHFLDFCQGAGLSEDDWSALLIDHFRDILGSSERRAGEGPAV